MVGTGEEWRRMNEGEEITNEKESTALCEEVRTTPATTTAESSTQFWSSTL